MLEEHANANGMKKHSLTRPSALQDVAGFDRFVLAALQLNFLK